jgi:hypothetical protein
VDYLGIILVLVHVYINNEEPGVDPALATFEAIQAVQLIMQASALQRMPSDMVENAPVLLTVPTSGFNSVVQLVRACNPGYAKKKGQQGVIQRRWLCGNTFL